MFVPDLADPSCDFDHSDRCFLEASVRDQAPLGGLFLTMQLKELIHNKQFLELFKRMYLKNTLGVKVMQYEQVRKHGIYMWRDQFAINKGDDPKVCTEIDDFVQKHGIILI